MTWDVVEERLAVLDDVAKNVDEEEFTNSSLAWTCRSLTECSTSTRSFQRPRRRCLVL